MGTAHAPHSGEHRTTRTQRKPRMRALTALRRQEIVQAALKTFSRKGFEAACMEEIAAGARIAKGTLYLYFRSKEALYAAVVSHAVEQMQQLIGERTGAATGLREKLTAAIATRLQFWTDHGVLYTTVMTMGREARHRRQTNDLLRSSQAQLLALFEEAIHGGELIPGDYGPHAWAVLDLMRGASERRTDRTAARRTAAGTSSTVADDAAFISAFALRGLGAALR